MSKLINIKSISATLFILLAIAIYSFTAKSEKVEQHFTEVKVERDNIQLTISATGEVEPRTRLELNPPVAGRIESLQVKEGDTVKEGDIIGYLSSTERVALIDAARAKGPKELKEWKELYKAIPLVAPIDGTVIARSIEPGQTVESSTSIITLSDTLIISVEVDETDIAKISKGQQVQVTLDSYPDVEFTGEAEHIAFDATYSDNVRVYEVKILPHNHPKYMKSGMGVESVFITEKKDDALIIPRVAVQYDSKGAYVLKSNEKKIKEKQYLELGIQSGNQVEVISGIEEGQLISYPVTSFDKYKSATNPLISKPKMRRKIR